MTKKLTILFIVFLLGNVFCLAQNARENLKPKGDALEIVFHKERPPSYEAVPETEDKKVNVWYALFQRVPDWKPSADALPVRAVNFLVRREGERAKVTVSVHTGRTQFEKEEFVAALTMQLDDEIIVKDLLKFGVEPFKISLVKITPSVAALPVINNKSSSVSVASVRPNYSTLPTYTLTLANNSSKAVSAFTFDVKVDGKIELSGMPQGFEGQNLIEPGGFCEKTFPNDVPPGSINEGQVVPLSSDEIFTISSVVFEDGTFEGDELKAADFLAFNLGRKLQVGQILNLLRQVNEKKIDFENIRKQAENLNVAVDETNYQNLIGKVPNLSDDVKIRLRRTVEFIMKGVRNDFLKDIRNAEKENSGADWLAENSEKYKNWLARFK